MDVKQTAQRVLGLLLAASAPMWIAAYAFVSESLGLAMPSAYDLALFMSAMILMIGQGATGIVAMVNSI